MTSSYPETDNFGFTRVGEGESYSKDGFGVTDRNWIVSDRVLKALASHDHSGGDRLADPVDPPEITQSPTGGTLPAGQTYYYQIAYEDIYGLETAPSPEVAVTTPPPLGVPTAPALTAESSGGTLVAGTYRYVLASRTAGGGLTTTSTIALVQIITGTANRILINLPDLPVGAEALVVFRSRPGQSQYYYWRESLTGADMYDDGSILEDTTITAPAANTSAGTNSITVTLPGGVLPADVSRWRVYRTSNPGIYNGLNLVHLVSEGLTESDPEPRPDWTDDGSPMLRGQPRRASATLAPPPEISGGGGGTVTPSTVRVYQDRTLSAFAAGTLVIDRVYATLRNEGVIKPGMMEAYFLTPPVTSPTGAQVGFALEAVDDGIGSTWYHSFGGGAANINQLSAKLASAAGKDASPADPTRVIADPDSNYGSAKRLGVAGDYLEFTFNGLVIGPGDYFCKIRLRTEGVTVPAANDLRINVENHDTSVNLLTQDLTPYSSVQSSSGAMWFGGVVDTGPYYIIVAHFTVPPASDSSYLASEIRVKVSKLLSGGATYLVDEVEMQPQRAGLNAPRDAPLLLKAALTDYGIALAPFVEPLGNRFGVAGEMRRHYAREGMETSVDLLFYCTDGHTFTTPSWTVASDQAWAVPTPGSGSDSLSPLSVAVDFSGMAAGTRNVATITISAASYADLEIEIVALKTPAVLGGDANVAIAYNTY